MQFVRYTEGTKEAKLGVLSEGAVFDLAQFSPDAPTHMLALIEAGEDLRASVASSLKAGTAKGVAVEAVTLLAPIERPGKFICLGLNYAEHVKEGGRDLPEFPTLFLRVQSSLLGPNGVMELPKVSDKFDFEAELLVVIGKRARNVSEKDALDHVFGYTAFNDGSLRDYQKRTTQWTAGKNFDATGPFGPAIVTADELPPGATGLSIRSRLNGTVMQDGNTRDMIFSVARLIADASEIMTLEPGDCLATGTPSGVGFARTPPVFLRDGDVIDVEIEGIPVLSNKVAAA